MHADKGFGGGAWADGQRARARARAPLADSCARRQRRARGRCKAAAGCRQHPADEKETRGKYTREALARPCLEKRCGALASAVSWFQPRPDGTASQPPGRPAGRVWTQLCRHVVSCSCLRTWRGADSVQCLSVSANPFASPRSVLWSRAQSRTRMRGRGRRSCRPSASSRADLNPRRPHAPWPRRGRITLYTAYAARGGREGGKARLTWPASNFLNERLRPSLLLVFAVVLAWARRSRPPGPALPWPAWAAWAPALLQYSNHP